MSLLNNMRGPRLKTRLLLLLLLLSSLSGKAFCKDDESSAADADPTQETHDTTETGGDAAADQVTDGSSTNPPVITSASSPTVLSSPEDSTVKSGSGDSEDLEMGSLNATDSTEGQDLDLLVILIPAVVAAVLTAAIICGIIIKRPCNNNSTNEEMNKEDPYLDGSSTEKVPMPMFEEDVPSVLELEMDELDKWMQKDCRFLETSP